MIWGSCVWSHTVFSVAVAVRVGTVNAVCGTDRKQWPAGGFALEVSRKPFRKGSTGYVVLRAFLRSFRGPQIDWRACSQECRVGSTPIVCFQRVAYDSVRLTVSSERAQFPRARVLKLARTGLYRTGGFAETRTDVRRRTRRLPAMAKHCLVFTRIQFFQTSAALCDRPN